MEEAVSEEMEVRSLPDLCLPRIWWGSWCDGRKSGWLLEQEIHSSPSILYVLQNQSRYESQMAGGSHCFITAPLPISLVPERIFDLKPCKIDELTYF